MRILICAWCNTDEKKFESAVPLQFIGLRNQRLGYSNKIDILFLDGYSKLGDSYKNSLQELGFELHDCHKIYTKISKKFSSLNQFGDYEKKCFLRWLVIDEYFSGEPILHFDGDIVFNEDPVVLKEKLNDRTCVIQGCPAVACICSKQWFEIYRTELSLFAKSINVYSEGAWNLREGYEITRITKWSGDRDRKVISSDQDLISHLIHRDLIIQDRPDSILDVMHFYIIFENPLYIHSHNSEKLPLRYSRINDIDFLNDKKVAFYHMQNNFCVYLSRYINLRRILNAFKLRLPNPLESFVDDFESQPLYQIVDRVAHSRYGKKLYRELSRLEIYQYFFEDSSFKEVFNNEIWWKKKIFI
jgi:hypothetical protein